MKGFVRVRHFLLAFWKCSVGRDCLRNVRIGSANCGRRISRSVFKYNDGYFDREPYLLSPPGGHCDAVWLCLSPCLSMSLSCLVSRVSCLVSHGYVSCLPWLQCLIATRYFDQVPVYNLD